MVEDAANAVADAGANGRIRGTRFNIGGIGADANGSRSRGSATASETSGGANESRSSGDSAPPADVAFPRRRRTKADSESAKQAADMLIGMAQSVAVMRYGEDGKMLAREYTMTREGLNNSLSRLPQSTTRRIADMSAPFMLVFGVALWGSRLSELERRRRANHDETRRAEEAAAVFAAESHLQGGYGVPPQETRDDLFRPPPLDEIRNMQEGI
jgi:hypothetical protein